VSFSNLWLHPKTTIAGFLLCLVSIGAVLSQYGVTFGHLGNSNTVIVLTAIATAMLGLLSRDPGTTSTETLTVKKTTEDSGSSVTTQKLSGLMLIAVLLMGTMASMTTTGCTQVQKISVAQEIVNWTPTFISTANLVNSSIMALDPPTIAILGPLTLAINTLGPEFQKAAQAYLNNPNQTNLQLLQALIVQIQQDANAALLAAVKITNPASQNKATQIINLIATVAQTLLGLIQSISSKAQLVAMSHQVRIPLAVVRPYMDQEQMVKAADKVTFDLALNEPINVNQFFNREAALGF
jgi:hypothetical protein